MINAIQPRTTPAAAPTKARCGEESGAAFVDKDRVKDLFLELTQIPGDTGNERAIADNIIGKLSKMGYTPKEDGAKEATGGDTGNLILDVPGTVADAPGVILMAHMDTVELARDCKPQIRDGIIYSDGTTGLGADDRSGCSELLETLRILDENHIAHGPLQFIFTHGEDELQRAVGEEGGLLGSQALNREDVHGHIGYAVDSFHPNDIFWGWNGPLFADDSHNAHDNKLKMQAAFAREPGPNDTLKGRNNAEEFLLDFTRDGIRQIGLEPNERNLFGASSDAASLRHMGIPAMTIGAGEQDIHTEDEHVSIEDLGKSTELILTLVQKATQYTVDAAGAITPREQ